MTTHKKVVGNTPDPYEQGTDAAHTNQSQASCPYDYSTTEGEQWVQGYQDAGGVD